jgi:restriction endonuclease S subunit
MEISSMEQLQPRQHYRPYPAYKDSGLEWLGEIPAHWQVRRLRFIANLNPPPSEVRRLAQDVEVSFVPMEAIGEYGRLDLTRTRPLADVRSGYTYFGDGDVVVVKITPGFENGKGALAAGLVNGIAFGTTELHVLRTTGEMEKRYLFYLTLTDAFRRLGEAGMYGAGGQKRVPEAFVEDLKHAVPSVNEQCAIADFLDRETARIEALVVKKEQLVELLQEKRTALITHAVTKGLDPTVPVKESGVDWLGEIPEHWEVKRLKFAAPAKVTKLDVKPEEGVYLGLEHVESWTGRILLDRQPGSIDSAVACFKAGDVLLGKLPPYFPKVTRPHFDGACTSEFLPLRPLAGFSQGYVMYCLLSPGYVRWLDSLTSGTKMPRVSLEHIGNGFIPAPSELEQRAIAGFLDRETARIDALIAKVQEATGLLRELRVALISAAVTGKIDVRGETV